MDPIIKEYIGTKCRLKLLHRITEIFKAVKVTSMYIFVNMRFICFSSNITTSGGTIHRCIMIPSTTTHILIYIKEIHNGIQIRLSVFITSFYPVYKVTFSERVIDWIRVLIDSQLYFFYSYYFAE